MSEFLGEASVRLGISKARLTLAVRASQVLSKDELEGILSAIQIVQDAEEDPLADVDEPMDAFEAARELVLAEMEIESNRQVLLKDCISASEATLLTGRSRQVLERLRREGRLVALRSGNQWRYLRWQFDRDSPGGILPGLAEVLNHLGLSSAGAAFWLLQPTERLGAAPIDLLRRHQPEPVIQLALEDGYMP
jgi:hypothetical protein